MRKLIIAAVLIVGVWTAYWFIAKTAVTSGVQTKIGEYRAQGYTITHSDLDVGGYPLAFNVNAGPVSVIAPDAAGEIKGARAQLDIADISAAAYLPTVWSINHSGPGRFDIPAGSQRLIFETQTQAARIDAGARVTGGLSSLAIDARAITVTQTGANTLPVKSLDTLDYKFKRKGGSANYTLDAQDIALAPGSTGKIGQALGDNVSRISGIMNVIGYAGETPSYSSDDFSVLWGKADMGGTFALTRSPSGLTGKIGLNVANEQDLISELTSKGILSSGEAMVAGLIIGGLPKTEAGRRQITLSVSGSRVSLGPIKLGRLPF